MRDLADLFDKLRVQCFIRSKTLIQAIGANPKRSLPVMVIFLAGVHRSGTNMMMRVLERSIDTEVFHESDPRAFDNYMMRGEAELRELIRRSRSRRIVFKSLHEAHKLRELMESFSPSKSIWIYRHFDDVVNSIQARWPGLRNRMDEIITHGESGGWRGLGMTPQTRHRLATCYHQRMNDASITALFWYQRNQLLLEQRLERDKDCLLIDYARLTRTPVHSVNRICKFLDITYSDYMSKLVHARSIGTRRPPPIEPEVRQLCHDLYERLAAAS